ncbi:hypothetical protein NS277_07260 [Novosphingobium barchaimii]|nr:hypothetical protein NS277_07260 [Novosphingobium barchaimii]
MRKSGKMAGLLGLARQPFRNRTHRGLVIAEAVREGPIEHRADTLSHPPRVFRDVQPDFREDVTNQRPVDLVDLELAQLRIGVEFERLDPLLGVLAVLPALHHFGMSLLGGLFEGWNDLRDLPALLERVDARGRQLLRRSRLQPRRRGRNIACVPQPDIAARAFDLDT